MQKKQLLNFKEALIHLLIWSLVWFFFRSFFSVGTANKEFLFWFSTLLSLIALVASYVFVYDLIPKYLLTNQYRKFAIYTFYSGVFVTTGVLMTVAFGFVFFFNLEYQKMPVLIKSPAVILVCVLLIVALASALKILKHSYKSLEEKKTLENKFLQTKLELKEQELRFLKMQIHPHFLFNSLNTIYGFAIAKADEAPEMILKLSNLLDYILYQVEKPKVLLAEEINHLEDYISLEKMRFHDTLQVSFKIENINDSLQISPMLLIPFVENSFKHGAIIDGVLKVDINLKIENNKLFFEIKNFSSKEKDTENGIGLENIKKRLLMLYPNKHQLKIEETSLSFKVTLEIEF
ncbi:sensor histidine kinase [Polaribacter sp. Hel1_85]|uniref:sensor histidine kinase n=1 Tax=Polaribacter sp. Hel1_85 TaxID=1250005 RepID=UPI00052E24C2|nr:histidine kinase [Polaribacter sp. Hel1_85]KGL61901.1 two-component system sensor histidine kinase [Polaribacter sp. Hel1_85]